MVLRSINPATEEIIGEFTELTDAQVDDKLALAQEAFKKWRSVTFTERAELLYRASEILRQKKSEYAKVITNEMGKTLSAAEAEIEKCATALDYCADNGAELLKPEPIETDASSSYVRFDPIGVILAVMPWNFPFWQVFRFLAPNLMAGNTGVLKHASNVQMSAQIIESVIEEAGFPHGTFQNLAIGSAKVERVINDSRIRAVTLTGSEYAGSQVAMQAGKMIKKTVMELGGSDPFIVLKDSDIDLAVESAVLGRMQANAGQSCIAAKRFIVDRLVVDEFTDKLVRRVSKLRVGNPLDTNTDVGPLVNAGAVADVERQVNESVAKGAKLLYGGARPDGKGYYYVPAVLGDITKGMPVYDEEVFGPALPIITASSEEEAIEIANDTPYGLGSTIFSANTEHAEELARQIEAGQVFINHQVKSDPRLPFGGVKNSGYGREVSEYGFREFVNIKTVWVR